MQRDYRFWDWHMGWLCVFAINLPLPVVLASGLECVGQKGMLAGVIVWLVISHFVFDQIPCLRGLLISGGICVALSQGLVVFHIFAGLVAAEISTIVFGVQGEPFATGFWLTFLTGGQLMVAVLIGGGFARGIAEIWWCHT